MTDLIWSVSYLAVPSVLTILMSSILLAVAIISVRRCPDDVAEDCHFVLAIALVGVLIGGALAFLLRAGTGLAGSDLAGFRTPEYVTVLLVIWAAGALYITLRLSAGSIAMLGLVRRAQRVQSRTAPIISREIQSCRVELHLWRKLRVVISPECSSPFLTGLVRPIVVLPRDALDWDAETVRLVLLHEFAHIERHDRLATALAQLVGTVYWWNPLYWVAVRHATRYAEMACDERVLSRSVDPQSYATLLVRLMRIRGSWLSAGFASIAMATPRTVHERFDRIMRPRVPSIASSVGASRKDVVVVTIVAVLIIATVDILIRPLAETDRRDWADPELVREYRAIEMPPVWSPLYRNP